MKSVLVLPFDVEAKKEKLQLIKLPNPSNIETKSDIELLLTGEGLLQKVYQLKTHKFSKGSTYDKIKEREQYHYKDDDVPVKSLVMHDAEDLHQGELSSNGDIQITFKYDLTFSIIGAFTEVSQQTKTTKKAQTENDYFKSSEASLGTGSDLEFSKRQAGLEHAKILNYVDFHEMLIYKHNENWEHISKDLLVSKLRNISEVIEENDEEYYKITSDKIVQWLLQKIDKIVEKFPASITKKFLQGIDSENNGTVLIAGKKLYALNLLVSLLPLSIYELMYAYLRDSIKTYHEYVENKRKEMEDANADRQFHLKQAMQIGVSTSVSQKSVSSITKKTTTRKVVKKKLSSSSPFMHSEPKGAKGGIDGFFKKR